MASDGSFLLAYLSSNRDVTVDLSRFRGPVRAQWFDPTNGATIDIGNFDNSGSQTWAMPGSNSLGDSDWILVVRATPVGSSGPVDYWTFDDGSGFVRQWQQRDNC
jgi:hypothetical protein